jgi:O-antigen/teichoic acid export membrane protein
VPSSRPIVASFEEPPVPPTATRSVAKNTFLLTAGFMFGRLLAVFVTKKMTPLLGPEGMGIWFLANDLTVILLTVANFGLSVLLTREVTRHRQWNWPLLWAALRLRWMLGGLCYALLLGYLQLTGEGPLATAAILVSAAGLFLETTAMACDSILQAHEKVQYQTWGQLVSAVVYFALAWWWLDAGWGLMGVIWANFISRGTRVLVMAPLMFLKTGPWRRARPDEDVPGLRWMLALGLPMFLATTFGILSYKVDTVMLNEIAGKAATGIYGLGHRALDILLIAPNIFATAMFPALARYSQNSATDTRRLAERGLRYMLLAALPLAWLTSLSAEPLIEWFARGTMDADPSEFAASITVLQLVIWGLPLQAANLVLNRTLIAAGRERVFTLIGLAALVTNVALNALLIPRFGYYGAGAATVITLAQSVALHAYNLGRTEYRHPLGRAFARPVATLAVSWTATAGLLHLLAPGWLDGWLLLELDAGWVAFLGGVGLWAALYAVAALVTRTVDREDLALLPQLLRRG